MTYWRLKEEILYKSRVSLAKKIDFFLQNLREIENSGLKYGKKMI
jgi:hypothetical protein